MNTYLILTDAQLVHLDIDSRNEYLADLKAAQDDSPETVTLPESDVWDDEPVDDFDDAARQWLREMVS